MSVQLPERSPREGSDLGTGQGQLHGRQIRSGLQRGLGMNVGQHIPGHRRGEASRLHDPAFQHGLVLLQMGSAAWDSNGAALTQI